MDFLPSSGRVVDVWKEADGFRVMGKVQHDSSVKLLRAVRSSEGVVFQIEQDGLTMGWVSESFVAPSK